MGLKSWQSLAGGLWFRVPHRPAVKVSVISGSDWGRVPCRLASRAAGEVPVLRHSWLEAALCALPRGFSIEQLTVRFIKARQGGRQRECRQDGASVFVTWFWK